MECRGRIFSINVSIFVTRDGTALALGSVSARLSDKNVPSSLLLIAQSQGTSAACADSDNDGIGGLTNLTIQLRDTLEGESYTLLVETVDNLDLHEMGRYPVNIVLRDADGSEVLLDGHVRLPGDFGATPRPRR